MKHLLLTSLRQLIILEAFLLKFEEIYSLLNPNFETTHFDWGLWTDMWWPSDFSFLKSLETPPWLFLKKGKPDPFACAMSSGKGTERNHLLWTLKPQPKTESHFISLPLNVELMNIRLFFCKRDLGFSSLGLTQCLFCKFCKLHICHALS